MKFKKGVLVFLLSFVFMSSVGATNGIQSSSVIIKTPTSGSTYYLGQPIYLKYTVYDGYSKTYSGYNIVPFIYIEIYKQSGSNWILTKNLPMGDVKNNSFATCDCSVVNIAGCQDFNLYNTYINESGYYKINIVEKPSYYKNGQLLPVPTSYIPEYQYLMKTTYINVYENKTPTFMYTTTVKNVNYGDPSFINSTLINTSDGKLTYKSSNTNVAVVDSYGRVTIKSVGRTTITATVEKTNKYLSKTASYKVNVSKKNPTSRFSSSTLNKTTSSAPFYNYLITNSNGYKTYRSSNMSVATVDSSGYVTIKGAGVATITVTISQTQKYNSQTLSYKINVKQEISDGFHKSSTGIWEYYKNNRIDTTFTKIVMVNGVKYRFYKGRADNFTGIFQNEDGLWYYVSNGIVTDAYNGIWKTPNNQIYLFKNSIWQSNYIGFRKINNIFYYFKDGVWNKTYTGLVKNSKGIWYTKNGIIDFNYNGLYKGKNTNLYILKNGKVNTKFMGFKKINNICYYFKNGIWNKTYTGFIKNSKGLWYTKDGIVNFKLNKSLKVNGKTFIIKKNKVIKVI